MDLQSLTKQLIYDEHNIETPDIYQKFGIVCPEYSSRDIEVKEYPMPDKEHLFTLLWDIPDNSSLYATILPCDTPFTYSCHFKHGMRTQMHSHEYLELFYIIDGEYRQKILGSEFTFHKGELCLIDKNCQHQEILDSSNATILFLGITNFMFDDIVKHHVTTERISSFLSTALLEQKTLQQGLLIRIFHILSTKYEFSLSKQLRKRMNWILFEEITNYINNNLNNISIMQLSNEFHFQEDYFNRLLKSQTGLTYTEYLQSLRLKKAEDMLINTDHTIDTISHEVGYQNKGYFYKIFTDKYKITPAQFRKKNKS